MRENRPSERGGIDHELDVYDLRALERRLAEDDDTAELGVRVCQVGHRLVVRGQVAGDERRARVIAVVRETCGDLEIIDELACAEHELSTAPSAAEEIR